MPSLPEIDGSQAVPAHEADAGLAAFEEAARHEAACVLQRQSRGFVARRSVNRSRAAREEERRRDAAARAIQTHSRGHLARGTVHARRREVAEREVAAIKIQQAGRKRDACKRVAEARAAYLAAVRVEAVCDDGNSDGGGGRLVPHSEPGFYDDEEKEEEDLMTTWCNAFLPPRVSLAEK